MITIDILKNHPQTLPRLAKIWYEALGSVYCPDTTISQAEQKFLTHLSDNELPLTYIALEENTPIGMCSLRKNDGIRPDVIPWLASLVVDPDYQRQGIGKRLIEAVKTKAKELGFSTLHLFAFDVTISDYYARLGWSIVNMDTCKEHPIVVMEMDLVE